MDISPISGLPMVEEPNPYAEASAKEVDRDAFIKMFLAQMKHQDPLNPMDGSEFAAQLAQFSSLEQLYNVNESLDGLKSLQEDRSRYEVMSLIGKEITAEGGHLSLDGNGARGGFELKQNAECSVVIKNEAGIPVQRLSPGYLEPGRHEFEWDGESGSGTSMPDGLYHFEVSAVNPYGETVSAAPRMMGRVDRISLEGDAATLYVGSIPLKLSSVVDIRSPHAVEAETEAVAEPADDPAREVGI